MVLDSRAAHAQIAFLIHRNTRRFSNGTKKQIHKNKNKRTRMVQFLRYSKHKYYVKSMKSNFEWSWNSSRTAHAQIVFSIERNKDSK